MKHFYALFAMALLSTACSKDKFDPKDPKNGQETTLYVDHYTTGRDGRIFLNTDRNNSLNTRVDNFDERELGYTYVIKARVVRPKEPLADAPSWWYSYEKTIQKDKYQGLDTFVLPLFGAAGPFEFFCLRKEADKYYYNGIPLSVQDDQVKADFDKALELGPPAVSTASAYRTTMTLHAQHDPNNYTKGYLVYKVTF